MPEETIATSIMDADPICISQNEPISDAIIEMRSVDKKYNYAIVVNAQRQVLGILIADKLVDAIAHPNHEQALSEGKARDFMLQAIVANNTDTVTQIAKLMDDNNRREIVIIDRLKLVGVVTHDHILDWYYKEHG